MAPHREVRAGVVSSHSDGGDRSETVQWLLATRARRPSDTTSCWLERRSILTWRRPRLEATASRIWRASSMAASLRRSSLRKMILTARRVEASRAATKPHLGNGGLAAITIPNRPATCLPQVESAHTRLREIASKPQSVPGVRLPPRHKQGYFGPGSCIAFDCARSSNAFHAFVHPAKPPVTWNASGLDDL